MENISKYLEDKKFIQWVFNPDEDVEKWWKTIETANPQESKNISLARNIIIALKTSDKKLSEEEKILLFSKVLKQIEEKKSSANRFKIKANFLKYAAVAILFFSIGAILFYRKENFNPEFYSTNLENLVSDDQAKLIRPNGEKILLEEKKSIIEYKQNGNVTVNNKVLEPFNHLKKGVPELNQLIIPYGKTSEVYLPDGTKVYLNAGSRLIYPEFFNDKNREVFLAGEAFFEVKHDPSHPFIVQTSDIRIKVLGTKFNISAYPSDNIIETVLTEGRLRLEQNNTGIFSETQEVNPDQMASFNKENNEILLFTVDTDNYTLWKDGLCKFESTDLNRVIKKLERFYNLRFNYDDPLLGMIKISGKLDLNESREEIINRVAVAASLQIIKKGDYIYEIKK